MSQAPESLHRLPPMAPGHATSIGSVEHVRKRIRYEAVGAAEKDPVAIMTAVHSPNAPGQFPFVRDAYVEAGRRAERT